jgi:ABC-type Na+ transport system ATPase subunit NatA
VVFSTHVLSEAEEICEEYAIIHGGCLLKHQSRAQCLRESGSGSVEQMFISTVEAYERSQGIAGSERSGR